MSNEEKQDGGSSGPEALFFLSIVIVIERLLMALLCLRKLLALAVHRDEIVVDKVWTENTGRLTLGGGILFKKDGLPMYS